MQARPQAAASPGRAAALWRRPAQWLREQNLSRGYWRFFTSAFFFDAGFAVYFFLFNLYLLDFHFNDRAIGWVSGALTLGSLAGTLPAGELARRYGVKTLLILCFVSAPMMGAMRTLWMWEPAQIGLAFLAGAAMSGWGVAFLPTVARLTTERNRASAFSLIFSVSIGTSALGGVVCGYLPRWLRAAGYAMQSAEVKRLILLLSCALALVALVPAMRLHVPAPGQAETAIETGSSRHPWMGAGTRAGMGARMGIRMRTWMGAWKLQPFLLRYLPCMALWSGTLAAFAPFANVYLVRGLHLPLTSVALLFSTVQIVQFIMGLLTPVLLRVLGLVNGILATQVTAALALAALGGAHTPKLAIPLYLTFSAAQWISSPALYNLLMNETEDRRRGSAAAMTLFCNALAGSAATALAGVLFTRFHYPPVLLAIAAMAFAVALLFRFLVASHMRHPIEMA